MKKNPELGQVWTPEAVSKRMVSLAAEALGREPSFVLDPACGPATFQAAMSSFGLLPKKIVCIDVDSRMSQYTSEFCAQKGIKADVITGDYLQTSYENKADLVIMNPPYIRQELISYDQKKDFKNYAKKQFDFQVNQKSNLLSYFLIKALADLKPNGILCAIIYDSVAATQYGRQTLGLLTQHMDILLQEVIESPFDDAIIDARIVVGRKRSQQKISLVEEELPPDGYTSLSSLISTKRGTSLPKRSVYVASASDPYFTESKPILAKQNKFSGLVIKESTERAYLPSNDSRKSKVQTWLNERMRDLGKSKFNSSIRAISGPILFNYYIRSNPRHILNPNQIPATDNFYVSSVLRKFPTEAAWLLLNSELYLKAISANARPQGSGLSKLQLYEYKQAIVPDWCQLSEREIANIYDAGLGLSKSEVGIARIRAKANQITKKMF